MSCGGAAVSARDGRVDGVAASRPSSNCGHRQAIASNEPGGGAADGGARPQATRRHRCDTAAVAIEGTSSCVHCELPEALRSAETSLAAIVAACMMVAGLCVTGARKALAVARTTTTLSNDILAIGNNSDEFEGRRTASNWLCGHAGLAPWINLLLVPCCDACGRL